MTESVVSRHHHNSPQEPRGFDQYLAYLPPRDVATAQVVLTNLLGSVFYTK